MKRKYRERHLREGATLQKLLRLSAAVAQEPDYALGREYENPLWIETRNDAFEYKCFDLLRCVAKNDAEIQTLYRTQITAVARCVAAQLMDEVHFLRLLFSWQNFVSVIDGQDNDSGMWVVEKGALMVARSMWTCKELLSKAPRDRTRDIRATLNDLGDQLHRHINDRGGVRNVSILEAINLLKVLLEEKGVSVRTDDDKYYHTVNNPSLEDFLQHEKGLMAKTLAVLYACVLRRVGIPVDIICLPRLFLLGIPSSETYVDIFRAGRVRSREECQAVARPFYRNDEWTPQALNYGAIFKTMASFCTFRSIEAMVQLRSTRFHYGHQKALSLAFSATFRHSEAVSLPTAEFRESRSYLDPEIYRHFELINDETMERYMGAPYDEILISRLNSHATG
jgi:hypothetical protein